MQIERSIDSFIALGSNTVTRSFTDIIRDIGVSAADYGGADIGEQINNAYAALPDTGGIVYVTARESCYDFSTPIVANVVSKPLNLVGRSTGGQTNDSDQGGACLNYTPVDATVAITLDWADAGANGFFGAGTGMRDITLTNNGSCETLGGCGSSATGIQIGGTNGGITSGMFENVKLQGFGKGISSPDTGSQTIWGNILINCTFKSNTIGFEAVAATEGWTLIGGAFVNGGQAIHFTNDGYIKCFDTHFDNMAAAIGIDTSSGNSVFECHACHFENVNMTANDRHFIKTNNLKLIGGEVIASVATGSDDYWIWATGGGFIEALNIGSAGRTVTTVAVLSNNTKASFYNASPAILSPCPSFAIDSICAEMTNAFDSGDSTTWPYITAPLFKIASPDGGGVLTLKAATGSGGLTATFPAVSGEVIMSTNTIHFERILGAGAGGGCPTAALVGANCTSAAINLPVAMPDTTYALTCTISGATQVPVISSVTKGTTTFTVTIAAMTAAATNFTSIDCIATH